jgi:hypothetical protein
MTVNTHQLYNKGNNFIVVLLSNRQIQAQTPSLTSSTFILLNTMEKYDRLRNSEVQISRCLNAPE